MEEDDYVASTSQMDERSEDWKHAAFESKFARKEDKSVESADPDGTVQGVRSLISVHPVTNLE